MPRPPLFSFTFQKKKNLGGGGTTWPTHPLSKNFTIFPPPNILFHLPSFSFYLFSFTLKKNYFFFLGGGFKPPAQLIPPQKKKFTILPPLKHPFSSSFSFYLFSFIFQNNYYSIFFFGGGGLNHLANS